MFTRSPAARGVLCAAVVCVLTVVSADSSGIAVDWTKPVRQLTTTPAFQTVVNSLTTRVAPQHDAIFKSIADLGASYQRFVPWLPYPKLGVGAMEPPSGPALCGFVNSGGATNPWSTTLDCRGNGVITAITFASYGNPTGYCGSLVQGSCSSPQSLKTVTALCVGKPSCTVFSNDTTFGGDPCPGTATHLAIQAKCSLPGNFTYWDFTWPDQGMVDFMVASGNGSRSAIPNFSTPAQWLYQGPRVLYPDDPLQVTWGYEHGTAVVDATFAQFGEYYGRLVAHYVEGGFYDEYGVWVPGYTFNVTHWEVLNEIEGEHHDNPATYTAIYDAVVAGIRKFAPTGSANMQFVGMALESDRDFGYATYFLNKSNHVPGTPLDWFSFHYYASCSARDGGVAGEAYEEFFSGADGMFGDAAQYIAIRDALAPDVRIDADELGVILPDDNDPKYTSDNPGFPLLYWNAAAALYAYEFGSLSQIGLDVVGMSQLVGYPSLNITRTDNGEQLVLGPQYPSVAMLNWTDGTGTARYWALKLIIDTLVPFQDSLFHTVTGGGNPFCGSILNNANLTLACLDPGATITDIVFASYGTPSGSCPNWAVNNTCNAANSTAVVKAACLGQNVCSVAANTATFGDPCYGTVKHLNVVAKCSGPSGGYSPGASSPVYAQAYGSGTTKKVMLVNKSAANQTVTLPVGFSTAAQATVSVVDESTGFGPAAVGPIPSNGQVTLAPFAVAVAVGTF